MADKALLKSFNRHLRTERGLAENTAITYCTQVRTYLAFLTRNEKAVATATPQDVISYLDERRKAGLRSSSLFTAAIAVRQLHRFASSERLAPLDPTADMKLPRYQQRLPNPLSNEEMERLLDRPCGSKLIAIRNAAMLELLYSTCMRVTEMTSLKTSHVNLQEGWVRIVAKGSEERIVPIGPKAIAAVIRYLNVKISRFAASDAALFVSYRGRPMKRGSFWLALKGMARDAGLGKHVSPHAVRHSGATALLAGGADIRIVQEMLGHASIQTTQIYTHVNPKTLKDALRRSHPRF